MAKWFKTKYPGVRYREHPTRKHGVKYDRYYAIRFQRDGKRIEEGVGWSSKGITADDANGMLSELKRVAKEGTGPTSLQEKRAIKAQKEREETARQERNTRESITFSEFFTEQYLPWTTGEGKAASSIVRERGLVRKWIAPTIGSLPFKDISPFHLERLKANMLKAGQSPRSVQYALAVVRQVWNRARKCNIHNAPSPTDDVKISTKKLNNRRERFLSRKEAAQLLAECKRRSPELHDICLMSLYCGLRAGEIFKLTWRDVDLVHGNIMILDTKSGHPRGIPLPGNVKRILMERGPGFSSALVFPTKNGEMHTSVSKTFPTAVKALGFNDGISDRRQRVVFHTLRHTFASWLVINGIPLYTVQKLLGHSTSAMTERYAHLAPDTLKAAIDTLEDSGEEKVAFSVASEGNGI